MSFHAKDWERHITLSGGRVVFIRPIRPEDEALYGPFLAAVTRDDLRLRFFASIKEFSHAFIVHFTRIDYAKAMAFIALDEANGEMLGVARLHEGADEDSGEFAILVRSGLKGHGLGWQLMQIVIAYGRVKGLRFIAGEILRENTTMLRMCTELGFAIGSDSDEPSICHAKLAL